MKCTLTFLLVLSGLFCANAQQPIKSNYPSIGIGAGILSFYGDYGRNDLSDLSKHRAGYSLTLEQKLTSFASVSLNGTYGKLAQSERGIIRNLNFESQVIHANLNFLFNFDNGFILNKSSDVAPFIGIGIGYLKFDSYTDLKNKNGTNYHYWDDGSIRDLPQVDSNYFLATKLRRDYNYETKLEDPQNNYQRNTITIPLTAGVKLKLAPAWAVTLSSSYTITSTDYIDNFKNKGNDQFIFSSVTISYKIGAGDGEDNDALYEGVDFTKLERFDADDDGVLDSDDECQGTPKDVKVDSKGCPKDEDKDGIPDYLDQEPKSPKGAIVNKFGVQISDEELARLQEMRDSLATERSEVFKQNPSLRSLQQIDEKISSQGGINTALPAKFLSADKNRDGIIQSSEITAVIDEFFEGDSDFTVEKINELIDYFFEQ